MPTLTADESTQEQTTYRWTKSQYLEMGDMGWFRNQRVELIRGEIIQMAAMGTRHFASVMKTIHTLSKAFPVGYFVGGPGIMDLSADTEPETDVVVLKASADNLVKGSRANTALIVEVSDSSLMYDRTTKVELYAEAQLQEYWTVNVVNGVVEVHRDPKRAVSKGTTVRAYYADVHTYQVGESITPLDLPDGQVLVDELLPPKSE